jgi:hypothetical protein
VFSPALAMLNAMTVEGHPMQKQLWLKLAIMLGMLIGFLVVFTMMRGLGDGA